MRPDRRESRRAVRRAKARRTQAFHASLKRKPLEKRLGERHHFNHFNASTEAKGHRAGDPSIV
ncbi:MAG: hypothetical protein PHE55_01455 [Methylococcaceae bacterium]|nr:hypothetical protein [Methylococcaceae bacterium]